MSTFQDQPLAFAGFATVRDLQTFLIDNGLVISAGDGEHDEFAVTPKGKTIWGLFELCRVVARDPAWEENR